MGSTSESSHGPSGDARTSPMAQTKAVASAADTRAAHRCRVDGHDDVECASAFSEPLVSTLRDGDPDIAEEEDEDDERAR